jgi:hypothetical protein
MDTAEAAGVRGREVDARAIGVVGESVRDVRGGQ